MKKFIEEKRYMVEFNRLKTIGMRIEYEWIEKSKGEYEEVVVPTTYLAYYSGDLGKRKFYAVTMESFYEESERKCKNKVKEVRIPEITHIIKRPEFVPDFTNMVGYSESDLVIRYSDVGGVERMILDGDFSALIEVEELRHRGR